jgi:hypothetical protein
VTPNQPATIAIAPIRTVTAISITVAPSKPRTGITGFAPSQRFYDRHDVRFPNQHRNHLRVAPSAAHLQVNRSERDASDCDS